MNSNGQEKQGRETPPYFSGVTFVNFVEAHRRTQPTRFDRSIMSNIAGGDQARILKALRFFGLSDAEGYPTASFGALETMEGEGMQNAWGTLLKEAYPFLFSGFSLDKATHSQLEERFREQGVQGDTVRKAVGFFITIARLAGISLSPYFKTMQNRGPRGPRSSGGRAQVRSKRQPPPPPPKPMVENRGQSTSAKTITFRSGGSATLTVSVDVVNLSSEDRKALFGWIDAMTDYENDEVPANP